MMQQWLVPIAIILLGIITGFVVEKYIIDRYIESLPNEFTDNPENQQINQSDTKDNTQPENNEQVNIALNDQKYLTIKEILLHAFNNITFIWFSIAGCFIASTVAEIPDDIYRSLHTILVVAFLFSLTIFVARLTSDFVTLIGQRTQIISASIISNLTRVTVFIFGILIILQTVGVKITPILTTLGVGGLAIALAVQDTLSNLFAGLYLILSQQFKTGDYVKLETGQEGYVIDINWRTTTIKDVSNYIIIIPNSKLSSVIFTNCHLPVKDVILQIDVGVSYNSNLDYVEQITVEVAKQVMAEVAPEITDKEPFVRYHTFADSSINFTVFLRINEFLDRRLAKHLFIKNLHQRYQEENIEIPNPSRDIYIKPHGDENSKIYPSFPQSDRSLQ